MRSAGYFKSYLEDPAQIDVNSVRNDVAWYWNGSTLVSWLSCSYAYEWFWQSGWGLHENTFGCNLLDWNGSGFRLGESRSDVHFKNGVFCFPFPDTHVYYQPSWARGRYDGTLLGYYNMSWTGDCFGGLHAGYVIQRTMN